MYIHQSINVVSLKRMWVHSKSNHSQKEKKRGKYHNMTLTVLEYIFSCAFRNTFFDVNSMALLNHTFFSLSILLNILLWYGFMSYEIMNY